MATLAESVLTPPGRGLAPAGLLPRLPGLSLSPGGALRLAPAAALVRRAAAGLAEQDLVVDLGDSIGSGRWWRGFATLGALAGAAMTLALMLPPVAGPVPHAPTQAAQAEARANAIGPLAEGSPTGQLLAPTALAVRLAEPPERPRVELTATIGAGGGAAGLEAALRRAGVGRADLEVLGRALAGRVNLREVKAGTPVRVVLGRRETKSVPRPLNELDFRAAFDLRVEARRQETGELRVTPIAIRIDDTPLRVTGEVGRSLRQAARAAGLPESVIADYVRQMSHVIDFQREARGRDRFEFIIAHRRAETGETEMGRLLYAGLDNGRERISLMRWGPRGEFFKANGESVRKGLMRTPVASARLSSGFGMRFHPILGYSRMHQGVDFAAPTGTPVLASAGGRVTQAGWGGGYGNMITIDHGRGLMTRYAHLHRMNVRPGQQVGQGQVIGQVGSTGLSTGPHLHYEVWQDGRPVDPRQARFQGGEQLAGRDLASFKAEMARLKRLPVAGTADQTVAAGTADRTAAADATGQAG